MIKRAFMRCNGGDYFQGESCPFDGWSSDESRELSEVNARLVNEGQEISIANLRSAGASESTIKRTIVVEFGADASAFEALSPQGYVIDNEYKPLRKTGPDFK